jgi:hypothetical protein
MRGRFLSWWTFAEEATRQIASPRVDVAQSDRDVEPVMRESLFYRIPHAISVPCRLAWRQSATHAIVGRVRVRLIPDTLAARVRMTAVIAGVAAATTLTVRMVDPLSRAPLGWALPMAVLVAALIVFAAGDAVALAIEDRMRTR